MIASRIAKAGQLEQLGSTSFPSSNGVCRCHFYFLGQCADVPLGVRSSSGVRTCVIRARVIRFRTMRTPPPTHTRKYSQIYHLNRIFQRLFFRLSRTRRPLGRCDYSDLLLFIFGFKGHSQRAHRLSRSNLLFATYFGSVTHEYSEIFVLVHFFTFGLSSDLLLSARFHSCVPFITLFDCDATFGCRFNHHISYSFKCLGYVLFSDMSLYFGIRSCFIFIYILYIFLRSKYEQKEFSF